MKHSVVFKNQTNKWDTALLLGNGIFGAMLFYEKNKLFMPMNHYEVYYNISSEVLPKDKLAAMPRDGDGKAEHAAACVCGGSAIHTEAGLWLCQCCRNRNR